MTYEVIITEPALEKIFQQATYIRDESKSPETASRWLQRALESGNSLGQMPRRCARAKEDDHCPYEVRAMKVGTYTLLFTVVEETKTVWVINARSGWQLPRPQDLPNDIEELEEDA